MEPAPTTAPVFATAAPLRGAPSFAATVLRAISWQGIAVTQSLGSVFALVPWLVHLGESGPDHLPLLLMRQALSAWFILLAALAADEAVRRGWLVWWAFVGGVLCASAATALAQWSLDTGFGIGASMAPARQALYTFFGVGTTWGTVLMVYLNRRSAQRILAGVRAGELQRLQVERQLIASRLAAAETEVDPVSVRQRLAEVRELYAAGAAQADARLEQLIVELRASAARGLAAAEGIGVGQASRQGSW